MEGWDSETKRIQKECEDVLALIRARNQKRENGMDVSQSNIGIRQQIKGIEAGLKKLEKDLSSAEEGRLVTSGELQRREDAIVDLTNFKDRLEQLLDKKKRKGDDVVLDLGHDDDDGEDSTELLKLQKTLRDEQDEHLESLSHVLARQKNLGQMIGEELDVQSGLLDDLDDDLDRTKGKMTKTMKTLNRVGDEAKNRKSIMAISVLMCVIVIVIVVVVVVIKK